MDIQAYVKRRLETRKILLMTHCVVGYPSLEVNWQMLEAMQAADVDLVELQLPFSEPMADGALFVKANEQALQNGITTQKYFDFLARASQKFTFPIFSMGYYNPIFKLGHANFVNKLAAAGGKGFIIPDLPLENYEDLFALSKAKDLSPILFFTPNTDNTRMLEIAQKAAGFIYCVARKGVTGNKTTVDQPLIDLLASYKKATTLPLAVGFGLNNATDIETLKGKAEIAIVGTALLKSWEEKGITDYNKTLLALVAARI